MWGTFLSEPLPIVALVGRYPANQLMGRTPILYRYKYLSSISHAKHGMHAVLILLSQGYPAVKGRSDTRYSPVRRSPSYLASQVHAAPRLACVKPIASVHPEPGSNSPLYILSSYFFLDGRFDLTALNRQGSMRCLTLHYSYHRLRPAVKQRSSCYC